MLPLPSPEVFFVESVCDDPEVIAANILVRAALAVGTRALGARSWLGELPGISAGASLSPFTCRISSRDLQVY